MVPTLSDRAVVFGVMTAPEEDGPPQGRRILSSPSALSEGWEEKKKSKLKSPQHSSS